MAVVREAPGRGRVYALESGLPGIEDSALSYASALLIEASDRVIDLVGGIDPDALRFSPTPETPSIARFAIHMAWAEAGWLSRISGIAIPEQLEMDLKPGNLSILQGKDEFPLPAELSSAYLQDLILAERQQIALPALTGLQEMDKTILDGPGPQTARQVIAHVTWHWIYHSGQIGLLRLQTGSDYTWSNA